MSTSVNTDSENNFLDTGEYVPGVCNIGPEEIKRRRNYFVLSLIGSILISLLVIIVPINPLWTLILVIPWTGTGVAYLQVYYKFCVAFGTLAVYNFTSLGSEKRVHDEEAVRKDRAKVLAMLLQSFIFGIAITSILVFIDFQV